MPPALMTADDIRNWLVAHIAAELKIDPASISTDRPIVSYGIDSMQIVALIARLEDAAGLRFASNPLDDHPTIEALSRFVADQGKKD